MTTKPNTSQFLLLALGILLLGSGVVLFVASFRSAPHNAEPPVTAQSIVANSPGVSRVLENRPPDPSPASAPASQPAQGPEELLATILSKPGDRARVEKAQRARIIWLMEQGQHELALAEAKSYYNVVSLANTRDAIDLLAQALEKTRGAVAAEDFRFQQTVRAAQPTTQSAPDEPGLNIFATITVDPAPYQAALARRPRPRNVADRLARGNILLLADRAAEARQCFDEVVDLAAKDGKHIGWTRDGIHGVARAIRAEHGSSGQGDAFLLSLRQLELPSPGPSKQHDVRAAALQVEISRVSVAPVLELERVRQGREALAQQQIKIVGDFECAGTVESRQITPTHFEVAVVPPNTWFMFRVEGASGATVRIDLKSRGEPLDKWSSLNPMFSYVEDVKQGLLSPDPHETDGEKPARGARNGALLPDTSDQSWHFIDDVWRHDATTLSVVHRFEKDVALVAMRAPRAPTYNQSILQVLAEHPHAKTVEVGRSLQDQPLMLIQIGKRDNESLRSNPCILVYAGEHADEHDAGWIAQGMIEFLLSESPQAQQLREALTFLVIPTLDPDSTANARHVGITNSFALGRRTRESIAYANWLRSWVVEGKRLDLVLNFHNVQSAESPHLACAQIEGEGSRAELSLTFHQLIMTELSSAGLAVSSQPWARGVSSLRLSGWLSSTFGPIALAYEGNSQSPDRHLNIRQVKDIGRGFAITIGRFFSTAEGKTLLAEVDARRLDWRARWAAAGAEPWESIDAIQSEAQRSGETGDLLQTLQ